MILFKFRLADVRELSGTFVNHRSYLHIKKGGYSNSKPRKIYDLQRILKAMKQVHEISKRLEKKTS